MRAKPTAITELPQSPAEERRSRVIRYSVAMGIRMVCLVLAVVIPDWWRIIPIIGALVLPYVAVVVANNAGRVSNARVARPGALQRRVPDEDAA
jgi:predicted tellurium resistance membrane protein TerC